MHTKTASCRRAQRCVAGTMENRTSASRTATNIGNSSSFFRSLSLGQGSPPASAEWWVPTIEVLRPARRAAPITRCEEDRLHSVILLYTCQTCSNAQPGHRLWISWKASWTPNIVSPLTEASRPARSIMDSSTAFAEPGEMAPSVAGFLRPAGERGSAFPVSSSTKKPSKSLSRCSIPRPSGALEASRRVRGRRLSPRRR